MELLVASSVGVLTAGGVYLILRLRAFPVILGLALLSYAVNIFLFSTGRLLVNAPPVLSKYGDAVYTDPLPQALVLTAIVISFGMTAVLVMIAVYLVPHSMRGSTLDYEKLEEGVSVEDAIRSG